MCLSDVCKHVCMHACMYRYVCVCVCKYACMYVYVCNMYIGRQTVDIAVNIRMVCGHDVSGVCSGAGEGSVCQVCGKLKCWEAATCE